MSNIINDKVLEYINGYYKPLGAELAAFREDAEARRIPIILKDTESFLGMLLKLVKPRRILEIGTAVGYSAAFFAAASPACSIVTIEREDEAHAEALANMERLGISGRVTCLKGDAVGIMTELASETESGECGCCSACSGKEPFDFVFIDAGKSHYAEFLECSMKLVKSGAVIVCDNILMKAKTASDEYDPAGKYKTNIRKMREFVDILTADERLETALLAAGDGISVSIVK